MCVFCAAHRFDRSYPKLVWYAAQALHILYRFYRLCLSWLGVRVCCMCGREDARVRARANTHNLCNAVNTIWFWSGSTNQIHTEGKQSVQNTESSSSRSREKSTHRGSTWYKMLLYSFCTENRLETWKVCAPRPPLLRPIYIHATNTHTNTHTHTKHK